VASHEQPYRWVISVGLVVALAAAGAGLRWLVMPHDSATAAEAGVRDPVAANDTIQVAPGEVASAPELQPRIANRDRPQRVGIADTLERIDGAAPRGRQALFDDASIGDNARRRKEAQLAVLDARIAAAEAQHALGPANSLKRLRDDLARSLQDPDAAAPGI
jgi:hypothetical protein